MMDNRRKENHRRFKSSPPILIWLQVSITVSEHIHITRGNLTLWDGLLSEWFLPGFLFLRTNRVIIPSREEDEAIKHAREREREGIFNALRCLGCNYSAHHVMLYLSVSMDSALTFPLSRSCTHTQGKTEACVPKQKRKNKRKRKAEAKESCSILICLLL